MREGKIGVKEITSLIIAREFDEVILEYPHEDRGQEAGEEQDRHAGVDDTEPVNLRGHPHEGTVRPRCIRVCKLAKMQTLLNLICNS